MPLRYVSRKRKRVAEVEEQEELRRRRLMFLEGVEAAVAKFEAEVEELSRNLRRSSEERAMDGEDAAARRCERWGWGAEEEEVDSDLVTFFGVPPTSVTVFPGGHFGIDLLTFCNFDSSDRASVV